MSEANLYHGDHQDSGYERQDLSPRGVVIFLIGLAVAMVIFVGLVWGVYKVMDRSIRAGQPPVPPLAANAAKDTRNVPPDARMKFPQPRLEVDERSELDDVRLAEEQQLNTYGWVDQKAGVVRIPITRAMDLIAQRGLPVHAQGNAAAPAAGTSKAAAGQAQTKPKQ
jgi:hypothetical protein